jgi:hypothetical protein
MNIYIDIMTVTDGNGKNIYYFPTTHWVIDEHDTKTQDEMNLLRNELDSVLRKHLDRKQEG